MAATDSALVHTVYWHPYGLDISLAQGLPFLGVEAVQTKSVKDS